MFAKESSNTERKVHFQLYYQKMWILKWIWPKIQFFSAQNAQGFPGIYDQHQRLPSIQKIQQMDPSKKKKHK